MGKILVIAEKPSLGRSIAGAISWWKGEKFERQGKDRNTWLESDNYIVVSLVGHLYELIDLDAYFPGYDPTVKQPWDLKKLPFFPDDWKFKFEGKEKVQGLINVANQQMNRKDVDAIYNAGDPDREGQRLVDEVLLYGLKAPKTIYRLWLPDTTNKTIKQAFETAKPNAGYASLSSSAETRSEMDWLLGIELTRYVSIKAGGFTRIGRCVCPIVQHIIEREKAIKEFVPKPYSAVSSKEKTNGEEIELTSKRTFEEGYETEAQALADAFNKAGATVTDIKTERKTVNPGKLFSMSDLQSFAAKPTRHCLLPMCLPPRRRCMREGMLPIPVPTAAIWQRMRPSKSMPRYEVLHRTVLQVLSINRNSKASMMTAKSKHTLLSHRQENGLHPLPEHRKRSLTVS